MYNNNRLFVNTFFYIGYCIFSILEAAEIVFPNIRNYIPDGLFGIISLGCLFLAFFLRFKFINLYALSAIIFLIILCLISSFNIDNSFQILEIFFTIPNIINVCLLLFFSTEDAPEERNKQLINISYFMVCISFIKLFNEGYIDSNNNFDYMGFGYGTSLYWCIILQKSFKYKKLYDIIVSLVIGLLMISFGNRGVIPIILISCLVFYLKYRQSKRFPIFIVVLLFLGGVLMVFRNTVISILAYYSHNLGIPSYFIDKISASGLFVSNERREIILSLIALIKQHPFGSGIGADRVLIGQYAHNVVIELLVDFGIFFGPLIFMIILYIGLEMLRLKANNPWGELFLPFYIVSLSMLMLSNSIYSSTEFWIAIMIFCSYKMSALKYKKLIDRKGNIYEKKAVG